MDKEGLSTILLVGCLGLFSAVAMIYINGIELDTILKSITKHYFFN